METNSLSKGITPDSLVMNVLISRDEVLLDFDESWKTPESFWKHENAAICLQFDVSITGVVVSAKMCKYCLSCS